MSTASPALRAWTTPAWLRPPTPSSHAQAPPSVLGCTPTLTPDVRLTACVRMEDTDPQEPDSCVLTELCLTNISSDARPGTQWTATPPPSCTPLTLTPSSTPSSLNQFLWMSTASPFPPQCTPHPLSTLCLMIFLTLSPTPQWLTVSTTQPLLLITPSTLLH